MPNTYYRDDTNSLHCTPCGEVTEIGYTVYDPERLINIREAFALDHAECHLYHDIERARQRREHRKESDRRKILQRQGTDYL